MSEGPYRTPGVVASPEERVRVLRCELIWLMSRNVFGRPALEVAAIDARIQKIHRMIEEIRREDTRSRLESPVRDE